MTGLILVGLMPFAALGIALGHMLTVDSIGPAMGGTRVAAGAGRRHLVPGHHGFLHDLGQFLPSYWLVQAGQSRARRHGVGREGLGGRARLDGGAGRAGGLGVRPRHRPGVSADAEAAAGAH